MKNAKFALRYLWRNLVFLFSGDTIPLWIFITWNRWWLQMPRLFFMCLLFAYCEERWRKKIFRSNLPLWHMCKSCLHKNCRFIISCKGFRLRFIMNTGGIHSPSVPVICTNITIFRKLSKPYLARRKEINKNSLKRSERKELSKFHRRLSSIFTDTFLYLTHIAIDDIFFSFGLDESLT